MKKLIASMKNGYVNVYSIVNDEHMLCHSQISEDILREAIEKSDVDFSTTFYMESIDLGRIVGKDNCVEVNDLDTVKMLQRKGRRGLTPIVFNKDAMDTNLVTIGICRDDDGLLTVFTSFFGQKAPKEPWDAKEHELPESITFWKTHALVYNAGDYIAE